MSVFNKLFKKKKTDKQYFDQEQYELSAEVRRNKAVLRRLEVELEIERAKQELALLRQDFAENSGLNNPESLFTQLLQNAFMAKTQNDNAAGSALNSSTILNTHSQSATSDSVVLSRQQIEGFIKTLSPADRATMRFAPDEDLKRAIREKIPNINENSLNLCLQIARE